VLVAENPPDETDETPGGGGDGGPNGPRPDETPAPGGATAKNAGIGEVSSVSSIVGSKNGGARVDGVGPGGPGAGFVGPEGVSSGDPGGPDGSEGRPRDASERCYRLVTDPTDLGAVRQALDATDAVALDTETTGLEAADDRLRLLALGVDTVDGEQFVYLIDCDAVDPSALWPDLSGKDLVLHNAAFDLAFLARRGFTPAAAVHDTLLLAQLLTAGTDERNSLAACCRRCLNRDLDKDCQQSDWSGPLSARQLADAATDVLVLRPLRRALEEQLAAAKLAGAADVERRCLPAVAWLSRSGVPFDRETWLTLAQAAAEEAERLRRELDAAAPARPGDLFDAWNWSSPAQVKEALALAGCPVEDTGDDSLAKLDLPLARLIRRYREASKRAGTYGKDWLQHVAPDGRVYPLWRQLGAASGRMSCSTPNMQQLPRGEYRRCVAAPPARVLVKADFSQVELRIACSISGERAMLDAYRRGEDLHTATAKAVLGLTEVTKEHRQLANALNFGLLYGMGAPRFREYARTNYGIDLSLDQAKAYRGAFFRSYPGLARWHRRVGATAWVDTRTRTGRRRAGVTRFTEKLNTPVQGTGADGLKTALALLWERRSECPGAVPVLVIHDEIVVECDEGQAEAASSWLKQAMLDGMAPLIDPVPVEVEVKVGRTWGGE
jgi:DNA polymerase-1